MFVSPVSNLVGQVEGLRAQLLGLAPTAPSMCDPPPTFDALVSTGALTGDNGALIGGAAVSGDGGRLRPLQRRRSGRVRCDSAHV